MVATRSKSCRSHLKQETSKVHVGYGEMTHRIELDPSDEWIPGLEAVQDPEFVRCVRNRQNWYTSI